MILLKKIIKVIKKLRINDESFNNKNDCYKKSVFTNQINFYKEYEIGDFTYGKPNIIFKQSNLKIGKFCSIADNVTIFLGGNHRSDWITTYPFVSFFKDAKLYTGHPATKGDVIIGNDVWIGYGVCIMSGCRIGDGVVVGANSVITKDIPPYSIVAGNPARVVRYRFRRNEIESLLKIEWWNWPIEKIKEAWPDLMNSDVQKFVLMQR
ncbi:MAG: hypothetical protein CVV49_03575 [Spirochaetae bacterium HGW-Spirochaetae-5]|nr:MAG: hypothetical protein CVV49_03575 [Spirochaetae bacterium HGW-Spirochaetae-5]